MQLSPVRKLVPYAEAAKKRGVKVYHLNIGQPDIETPKEFFEAVKNFDQKVLAYAFSEGIPEVIDSFSRYYKSYGIDFGKKEILITNGGSEALQFSLLATCDCGDEILIPEPYYTNYSTFAKIAGVKVVPVVTRAEDGFRLPSKEEIQSKITPRTRAFIYTNPNNPTGAVYPEEDMQKVKEIALENNLFIIADEVYREFVYDGLEYHSIATIKELEQNVIVTDSISKRYSACGARIGCIASKNKEVMAEIMKLCQGRLCVATLEQVGAARLADVTPDYMKSAFEEYQKRRDITFDALSKMDGVICKKPSGAFYIVAKLPIKNAENFAIFMLENFNLDGETVMVAPAEGFYATPGLGVNEVRISYVLKSEDLKAAMRCLEAGLKAYKEVEK
jgi:aspartate aminotransferase